VTATSDSDSDKPARLRGIFVKSRAGVEQLKLLRRMGVAPTVNALWQAKGRVSSSSPGFPFSLVLITG
jgi:hypothetical protein